MDINHIEFNVKGSIVGHLIGDSLGYCWSDRMLPDNDEITMIHGKSDEKPGEYTSLGAMSLATIASLNECKSVIADDIMERFQDVYVGGYMTSDNENCYDVSPVTTSAINNFLNGIPLDKCSQPEKNSDCLNRMLPIALFFAGEPDEQIVLNAHRGCLLTHSAIECQVACSAYCLIVRNFLLQRKEKVFDKLIEIYQNNDAENYVAAVKELQKWSSSNVCSGTSDVYDCFWSAWKSFSKYESDYRFAVLHAIKYGNDSNGTCALTGSLSALVNGLNDIPQIWLNTLKLTSEGMGQIIDFTDSVSFSIFHKFHELSNR